MVKKFLGSLFSIISLIRQGNASSKGLKASRQNPRHPVNKNFLTGKLKENIENAVLWEESGYDIKIFDDLLDEYIRNCYKTPNLILKEFIPFLIKGLLSQDIIKSSKSTKKEYETFVGEEYISKILEKHSNFISSDELNLIFKTIRLNFYPEKRQDYTETSVFLRQFMVLTSSSSEEDPAKINFMACEEYLLLLYNCSNDEDLVEFSR